MESASSIHNDPFADPTTSAQTSKDATLLVGRNASLTLGTDSLIVLDEGFTRRDTLNCCGLIPTDSKTTRAIPFHNILWAELTDFEINIRYARSRSKTVVRPSSIIYPIEKTERERAASWVSNLLNYAYGGGDSQRRKRIKVLINPVSGKGNAQHWYNRDIEPILTAARCEIEVERTQYQGHGVDIAQKLDITAYDIIAVCSGDGLAHEVFNGLGKKRNGKRALSSIAVVQFPCGSANALSWNLNGTNSNSLAALEVVKGVRTPLDLVSITQGDRRTLSFLSQSFGIVAECDLDTDHLRWMGSTRFTWGYLVRLLGKTVYPCEIAVKVDISSKSQIREHVRKELKHQTTPLEIDSSQADESSSTTPPPPSFSPSSASSTDDDDGGLPPLQYGTVNDPLPSSWTVIPCPTLGTFFCGNMPLVAPGMNIFPASLPSDGFADLVTIDGNIPRSAAIRSMLAAENNTFFDMEHVKYRKISAYRLIPKLNKDGGDNSRGVVISGSVSIDGERIPCEAWQAEVHKGLGTVLSKRRGVYEGKGVLD